MVAQSQIRIDRRCAVVMTGALHQIIMRVVSVRVRGRESFTIACWLGLVPRPEAPCPVLHSRGLISKHHLEEAMRCTRDS